MKQQVLKKNPTQKMTRKDMNERVNYILND